MIGDAARRSLSTSGVLSVEATLPLQRQRPASRRLSTAPAAGAAGAATLDALVSGGEEADQEGRETRTRPSRRVAYMHVWLYAWLTAYM
jgi:hypothetical protein